MCKPDLHLGLEFSLDTLLEFVIHRFIVVKSADLEKRFFVIRSKT